MAYTIRIITGKVEYSKALLECQKKSPIWKLGIGTMKQLESEQYIFSRGFSRVK